MPGYPGQRQHTYTPAQLAWLAGYVPGRAWGEITRAFNARFDLAIDQRALWAACDRRGIRNGRSGQFRAGNSPWNEGKKNVNGVSPTRFQLGHRPHNHVPVGTLRDNDGYLEIKCAEPHRWRSLSAVRWEEFHNRFVPPGHVVVLADQDRRNLAQDNLVLASRAELAVLNKRGLIYPDAGACTRVGVALARVVVAASARRRDNKELTRSL